MVIARQGRGYSLLVIGYSGAALGFRITPKGELIVIGYWDAWR